MSWFKRNWKTIAGALCGGASVAVGVYVNPIAGIALGSVCNAAFGAHATTLGQDLTRRALEVLHPLDAAKLAAALKSTTITEKKP